MGVSQFKGIVLMKLLSSKSYSVLSSVFKLSFDLAFLFIKGFVTRIGLVFLLFWVDGLRRKYWVNGLSRKFRLGSEGCEGSDGEVVRGLLSEIRES